MRGHLIDGAERAGSGAAAVQAGESAWSRATAADLERALESLRPVDSRAALRAWRRAGDLLAPAAGEWLGLRLGLSAGEGGLLAAEAAALAMPGVERDPAGEPLLLRPHWRGLLGDLGVALGEGFAAGRPCVVLGDALLPELAQSWGEMLLEAGLAPSALAVLHAPAPELDRELEVEGAVVAGVGTPTGGVLRVRAFDDPEAAALHAARAAFTRVPALAGQRGHGPRLVVCDDRRFAAFTEALLAELGELGEAARLRPIDPRASRELRAAVESALDAGATPIHGCEGRFEPCVLTNLPPDVPPPPPGLPLLLLARG